MRKTKILFGLLAILLFLVGCGQQNVIEEDDTKIIPGVSDPSLNYCDLMGYDLELFEDEKGQSVLCIFPDGNTCDSWRFYEGVCGQEWSYCEQYGYKLESRSDGKDSYSFTYSMCLDKNTGEEVGLVFDLLQLKERIGGTLSR